LTSYERLKKKLLRSAEEKFSF